nr:MAG TPA: hypothetical protein [Caudoviricetes sp.]
MTEQIQLNVLSCLRSQPRTYQELSTSDIV